MDVAYALQSAAVAARETSARFSRSQYHEAGSRGLDTCVEIARNRSRLSTSVAVRQFDAVIVLSPRSESAMLLRS
jgi:hypothetical protein